MVRPFVSVLIDTYNHERFIEQAIQSVLAQDFPAAGREILVVDDGSTDRTPELVARFAPHVRLIRKANGGQASAFNAGIPECRGEIVAFLDGDDWWEPEKLSAVVREFAAHPAIGAVGNGLYEADEAGTRRFLNVPDRRYTNFLRTPEETRQFLELRSFLGTSRLAIRASTLARILPVPEALCVEADEYLATMAAAVSGTLILDQPLTNYRLHSGNLFQFAVPDAAKMERKHAALHCLAFDLPALLARVGVAPQNIELLKQSNWLDAERLRLSLGKGWPWETAHVEHVSFRLAYRSATFGYRLFHAGVLVLATLLPPRHFYKLRHWYAARGLARVRRGIGEAVPVPSIVVRRVHGS